MKRKINYAPTLDITSFQLTEGCNHNKCTFCSMFHSIPFHAISMDEIKSDLREASDYSANIDRVFLSGGDAFVLPANQLLEIASLIHKYLPRVSAISSYASKQSVSLANYSRITFLSFLLSVDSTLESLSCISK